MISIPQIELNVCREYVQRIEEKFPTGSSLSDRYLFILRIYEWQLRRKLLKQAGTLDNRKTLLTGHREAERFLFDLDVGSRKDVIAQIEDILQSIAVEFHAEIVEIESRHPDLRAEFAREKEEYRALWNSYIRDAKE